MLQLSETSYALQVVVYIVIFYLGAAVFSCLNVIVKRMPQKEKLLQGKRLCPECGQVFRLRNVLPLFSFIFHKAHKGNCTYCSAKYSLRNLFMEMLGGVLAVVCVYHYELSLGCLTMFLLLCVLAVVAGIDADTQEIPPVLNVIIFLIGLLSIITLPGPTLLERLIGMFAISLPLYLIVLVIPDGFGGGDIKMMFAAGFLLGWKGILFAFFVGLILGGGYGAFLLISKQKGRKEHFALGPFLSVGVAVSAYAGVGAMLVNNYISYIVRSMKL
ncbi:MAG: prepilin peptidase [Lachnospira sp.]|nr:prepilin peptidase [Lachnospira sp.]